MSFTKLCVAVIALSLLLLSSQDVSGGATCWNLKSRPCCSTFQYWSAICDGERCPYELVINETYNYIVNDYDGWSSPALFFAQPKFCEGYQGGCNTTVNPNECYILEDTIAFSCSHRSTMAKPDCEDD